MHLLSQLVQEELATIAVAFDTSTLDVERKHNLDRRSEARRVASVAKALRYGLVRHWRTESRAAVPISKARKEVRANKFANKVPIALEKAASPLPSSTRTGALGTGTSEAPEASPVPSAVPAALGGTCGRAHG